MSLLLDALRRAEEDSRKRKLAALSASDPAAPAAPVAAVPPDAATVPSAPEPGRQAAKPEVTLQAQTLAPAAAPAPSRSDLAAAAQPPAAGTFPDLIMVDADMPAVPNPGSGAPSYASHARPGSPQARQPASPGSTPEALREPPAIAAKPAAESLEIAAPMPATTRRQALSAATALAGVKGKKTLSKAPRRQWLLAMVALLLALPLAALLLFGDQFFGSSSTLIAVNTPRVSVLPQGSATPPATVTEPVSPPEAWASGIITAAAPTSPEVHAPVAAPALAAPRRPQAALQSSRQARVAPRPQPVTAVASRAGAPNRPENSHAAPSPAAGGNTPPVALVTGAARPASRMSLAYAAYQAGQPGEATRLYREVLQADPTQSDAWLGLAVIAHASNQREPAMDAYKRVLRLEPVNGTALAGIISLNNSADEPQQESTLRELLARSPQEADLNHALGLVLSGEQRWSEAQPLFFKAHALAPQEPQFAYNLAVTLDHLRKPGLAAQYYETAIGLAQQKTAGFDEPSARRRLAALKALALQGAAR